MGHPHHLAVLQHLALLRQVGSVGVRLVHQDRSQIQDSINNQVQGSEAHRTSINQTAINQYSQEPLQLMPQVGQMY